MNPIPRDISTYTPMMQQFLEIKAKYPHTLLLYRMGDFYETFFEDAQIAARELEITLTSRDGGSRERIDMAGIPYHALENYLPKLIGRGYKVAICEQMEPPQGGGKLVRREVVRVVTPGTLLEGAMLQEKKPNYLGAIYKYREGYGLAYVDISTGDFRMTEMRGENAADMLVRELAGLELAELVLPCEDPWQAKAVQLTEWSDLVSDPAIVSWEHQNAFELRGATERLKKHFGVVSLESFGAQHMPLATATAGAILQYLAHTQMSALKQIQSLRSYQISQFMLLDKTTRRNLELTTTYRENTYEGCLLWVLDCTRTAMGGRLLRDWMVHPLLDADAIDARLDAVGELHSESILREELRDALDGIRDVERLSARVATQSANPRDLKALAISIGRLPQLANLLGHTRSPLFAPLRQIDNALQDLSSHMLQALVDSPPPKIQEGGIFADDFHPELDELRQLITGGKDWIKALENSERERTGVKSLKVGFNKTFGYFIEVTHANTSEVPADYVRKQTLTNAERYITPALKEKEAAVLNADEQIKKLEYQLFVQLRDRIIPFVPALQSISYEVAQLDALASLAEVAAQQNYTRPILRDTPRLDITNSRHPVIEKTLASGRFVPNDVQLVAQQAHLMILTGPNMSGKSSYMRQVGLITLMAQMGSFVPADRAEIGICDRIFTRVGAVDDIATGQSTFMVEMMETSNILHHASARSLVLLDEIGRGTSTFDGVSIAWSVSEYIAQQIGCRTIFATHYHELNRLAEKMPGVMNYQVSVQEKTDGIVFLHKVVPGGADRSYGIEVARLAGLPATVLERAKLLLQDIEKRSRIQSGLLKKAREESAVGDEVQQLSFFE